MPSPLLDTLIARWCQAFAQGQDLSAEQLCPGDPDLIAELCRVLPVLRAQRF